MFAKDRSEERSTFYQSLKNIYQIIIVCHYHIRHIYAMKLSNIWHFFCQHLLRCMKFRMFAATVLGIVHVLGVLRAGSVQRGPAVTTSWCRWAPINHLNQIRSPVRKNIPWHLLEEPSTLTDKY